MCILRSRVISTIAANPRKALELYKDPNYCAEEVTPAQAFGTLAHMALLEPEKFANVDISTFTKVTKTGRTSKLVNDQDVEKVVRMQKEASPILKELIGEEKAVFDEPLKFTWHYFDCIAQPDVLLDDTILEYKTISSHPERYKYTIIRNNYHLQAGFYALGVEKATGRKIKQCKWIFQEKSKPFSVRVCIAEGEIFEEFKAEVELRIDDLVAILGGYPIDYTEVISGDY